MIHETCILLQMKKKADYMSKKLNREINST